MFKIICKNTFYLTLLKDKYNGLLPKTEKYMISIAIDYFTKW